MQHTREWEEVTLAVCASVPLAVSEVEATLGSLECPMKRFP